MNENIIEKLYLRFQEKGFLTNDEIFNELLSSNVSIIETERICNELLSKGVLISDKPRESNSEIKNEYDKAHIDYNKLYEKIIKKEPNLKFLVDYVKKIQPPQLHEVERLYPQIKDGNKFARKRLFEMNMRAVLKIAYKKAKEYNLSLEDTIQNAMLGLDEAIDRFDFSKHDKFQGYSAFHIRNSMERNKNIEETLWIFPAHFLELYERIYQYLRQTNNELISGKENLSEKLIYEISDFFNILPEEAKFHLTFLQPILRIDTLEIENISSLYYSVDYTDRIFSEQINQIINKLKEREREIIKYRFGLYYETDYDFNEIVSLVNEKIYKNDGCYNYGLSLTLEEVASLYGLTRERVRQIESKALKNLRKFFE